MTDALTKRKELKAKKPVFLAQDTHKKKRIRQRWKRPRGLQSKVRLNKRGYRRSVSTGWRSPKAARGLSPEGLIPIRVENLAQLEAIDPTTQGAMVSGRVSIRTKKILYDAAAQRSITILNRDAKVFEERYTAKMAEREERKKKLEDKRKRQEKLKKDLEKTKESGVAAEGLKAPKEDASNVDEKSSSVAQTSAKPQSAKPAEPESEEDAKPASASKKDSAESAPKDEVASKKADTPQKVQAPEKSADSVSAPKKESAAAQSGTDAKSIDASKDAEKADAKKEADTPQKAQAPEKNTEKDASKDVEKSAEKKEAPKAPEKDEKDAKEGSR